MVIIKKEKAIVSALYHLFEKVIELVLVKKSNKKKI